MKKFVVTSLGAFMILGNSIAFAGDCPADYHDGEIVYNYSEYYSSGLIHRYRRCYQKNGLRFTDYYVNTIHLNN